MHITVNWGTYTSGEWAEIEKVKLNNQELYGVYVVFRLDQFGNRTNLYVGRGKVQDRIDKHNSDGKFQPGALVTWARVDSSYVVDIEIYLIQQLKPTLNENMYPDYFPVHSINLPY